MYGGERERLLNGIILTSLSRNFFTDLRKASVDMPKPRFASSISQSANDFFSLFFILKKSLGKGPQCVGQRSLSYLVWPSVLISSWSCSVPTDPTISLLFYNPGQNLLRQIAKMPIFSCHPGKNWNLRQMNARFPPSPYPKLFRIAWQLYTLVFRPRQLWIGGGEGVYFLCLGETGLGRKR